MWQRFTERARKVVFYAQEEAQKYGEGYVSTEHLLLGLVREEGSLAAYVFEAMGLSRDRIRAEVDKQLPRGDARPSSDMTLTPRAKRVIDLAYDEARNLNNNYIGTEHLLLGLVREGDGLAGRVLNKLGMNIESTRRSVIEQQNLHERQRTAPIEPMTGRTYKWDEYDETTQRAILRADEMAKADGAPQVTPYYLVKALLSQESSSAQRALQKTGVNPDRFLEVIEAERSFAEGAPLIQMSPYARQVLDRTMTEADGLKQDKVGPDALLLGLVFGNRDGVGRILTDCGGSLSRLRDNVLKLAAGEEA